MKNNERDRLINMIFDLFNQACQVDWDNDKKEARFSHDCISPYEEAQSFLIDEKIIKKSQCVME